MSRPVLDNAIRTRTPKSNVSRQQQARQALSQHNSDRTEDEQASRLRSIGDIMNDLDGASHEELARLHKHQAKVNANFSAEDQDALEQWARDKPHKPLVTQQIGAALDWKLDLPSLFDQFGDKNELQRIGKRREMMLHGFTLEDRETVREMYQWLPFQTHVKRFFSPIHYAIYSTGKSCALNRPLNTTDRVTDALIHSHFNERALSCRELIFAVENEMGAKLSQIFVHASLTLFVMEWSHSKEFRCIVGFYTRFRTEETRDKSARPTIDVLNTDAITLCRKDLTDEEVDELPSEVIEKLQVDLGWLRRAMRNAHLAYAYYACAKWC
jgi:hypothetical protein